MNHANAAVAQLKRKHVGMRELARRVDVSPSTASGWLSGRMRPDAHHRAAIETEFGVPAGDWDRLPPRRKPKPARASGDAAPTALDAAAAPLDPGDVFAELARLRRHRQAAEAEGRLGDALNLGKVELRALLRLARANGELDPLTQVRRALWWLATVQISHTPEGSEIERRLQVVIAEEALEHPTGCGQECCTPAVSHADDPELAPAPGAAWVGLEALLRRAERLAGTVEGDAKLTAQTLAFAGRVRDALARVKGHPDAILANPHHARIRGRLLGCFDDVDEAKRAANREILEAVVEWMRAQGLAA